MERTIPSPYLNRHFIGYVLSSGLSKENQKLIAGLQKGFVNKFGLAIHPSPPQSLHITLLDWLAPLLDYGQDKDVLFKQIFSRYDEAMTEAIKNIAPIKVHFNIAGAYPPAIIVRGKDDGQYQSIRQRFLNKVELLPNTKLPPKIIHSTFARYVQEIDLALVRQFAAKQPISFTQLVDSFSLIRTADGALNQRKIIKTYQLK